MVRLILGFNRGGADAFDCCIDAFPVDDIVFDDFVGDEGANSENKDGDDNRGEDFGGIGHGFYCIMTLREVTKIHRGAESFSPNRDGQPRMPSVEAKDIITWIDNLRVEG